MTALDPRTARRVFLLLTATRWLPVGLVVALVLLRPLERGLTATQTLTVTAVAGAVTVLLELPTSGLADALGRRPLLVTAAAVNVAASVLLLTADSVAGFVVAAALMGVFRALDSGPLEAWYVDTVHVHRPGADVDQELTRAGTVLGASIALGALVSGGLVWWAPLAGSPLTLPLALAAALGVVHLLATLVLLREPTRATGRPLASLRHGVRDVPRVVRDGLGLVGHSRVLAGLMLAEATIALSMIGFESMVPLRLADLLGSTSEAGAALGPTAAAGWAVFAVGSAAGGLLSGRLGVARAAALGHALTALAVVGIGLAGGALGVLAAYLVSYCFFGGTGPLHAALVHREATAANRTTVLSLGSMVSFTVFAVVAPLAGLLSGVTSLGLATVVLGVGGLLGVAAYAPAVRAERAASTSPVTSPVTSPPTTPVRPR